MPALTRRKAAELLANAKAWEARAEAATELLREAGDIVDHEAEVIFDSNTDELGDFGTEPVDISTKAQYDKYDALVDRIRAFLAPPGGK